MIAVNSIDRSYNYFDFSLNTSSGDEITLSMYDDKVSDISLYEKKGFKSESMSLRHTFGYNFSYKGDGIDEQDLKEIKEALKLIKPMFEKFIRNIKQNDSPPDDKDISNLISSLKSSIPSFEDKNSLQKLKDETVDEMDKIISMFEKNSKIIESAKKFFDKLFDDSEGFLYYA